MSKRNIAAAFATAALASVALASPALATTDPVLIDTPGHTFQFGDQCAAGAAPGASGTLDWRDNTNPTPPTIAPRLERAFAWVGERLTQPTSAPSDEERALRAIVPPSDRIYGRLPSSGRSHARARRPA